MYILGGQDFNVIPNPGPGPPFISFSNFFDDVWRSTDGVNWTELTDSAGWAGRAGLSAVVLNDEIYVLGGSFNDDPAIIGGPPTRVYYNDVWKSADGITWTQLTDSAEWAPRAGAIARAKDGYIYVFGGEFGFTCTPLPFCDPPYFNDVWRSPDGVNWELVTASAEWSPRPGHQCVVYDDKFVLFGGFGLLQNPVDFWVSEDGVSWTELINPPWNATAPDQIKYDFDALVTESGGQELMLTFGGDRETFDFTDPFNYLRIDDDVWRISLRPDSCNRPTGLTATVLSSSQVQLQWNDVPGSTGYRQKGQRQGGLNVRFLASAGNTKIVDGPFKPSATYRWTTRARCLTRLSDWAAPVTFSMPALRQAGENTASPDFATVELSANPNPAGEFLRIEAGQAFEGIVQLDLFASDGRLLRRERLDPSSAAWEIDLQGVPGGLVHGRMQDQAGHVGIVRFVKR
jgi:hypothetical protein